MGSAGSPRQASGQSLEEFLVEAVKSAVTEDHQNITLMKLRSDLLDDLIG